MAQGKDSRYSSDRSVRTPICVHRTLLGNNLNIWQSQATNVPRILFNVTIRPHIISTYALKGPKSP